MEQQIFISKHPDKSPFKCLMRHIGTIDPHSHEMFELDMILSGTCRITVDQNTFTAKAGDVFSIEANTVHSFEGVNCTIISVQFRQSHFERILPAPKHPNFNCNSAVNPGSLAYEALRKLIARLVKNNTEARLGYEVRNWSMIYAVMDIMYQHFRIESSEAQNKKAHRYASRMSDIIQIIHENYKYNFTLSDLADRVHLSVPYLSKFFADQFGENFLSYLTGVRLTYATEELLKTDDTIENISANAGFPNSQAFVQAFKLRNGQLPSVYRRMKKTENKDAALPAVEQHDYMALLRQYLKEPSEETVPADSIALRASLSAEGRLHTLKHSWKKLLAINSASAILISDNQEILKKVQKEIGYEYIKFNGILSDDMHIYAEKDGRPVYSFVYVDKVLDFLLSIGLKPMIQLSFLPEELAKDRKKLFGYLVSEPSDTRKWADLAEALILHLQARYGKETVREWLFSVWEQPDTPSFMYGFSRTEDFYGFYKAAWESVKRCDPQIRCGAPSTFYIVRSGYRNWYMDFVNWCRQNGCMPDFMNFHYYDTTLIQEGESGQREFGFTRAMKLNESSDGINRFVDQVLSECHSLVGGNVPIYLSEWNNTPSQQDLLNDTCFKSCYIVKGILENYDRLDSFAYWSLTDLMGETAQPEDMFFGGLGLFTTNKVPKASYYAFKMLSCLGDTLIGRGPGWFAARSGSKIQIILYNYRHFSQLYAMGERFDMTFTDRYTPFSPEEQMDVHLSIRDLASEKYRITETIINRHSGSSFDLWVEMGGISLESAEEVQNLASRSVPAINKYVSEAKDGVLRLDALLEMLEVRLITAEPI